MSVISNQPTDEDLIAENNLREINGIPPDYVTVSCQYAKPEKKVDKPECKVTKLVVKKGKRQITLTKNEPNKTFEVVGGQLEKLQKTFGIVADFKGADIKCEATMASGPCTDKGKASHTGKTFNVNYPVKSQSSTNLNFDAFSKWLALPWKAVPKPYKVEFNTCSETLTADILVYPDIEFGIGFEWKMQKEEFFAFQKQSKKDLKDEGYQVNRVTRKKTKSLKKQSANYVTETFLPQKVTKSLSIMGFYKFSGVEIEFRSIFKKYIEYLQTLEAIVEPVLGLVNDLRGQDNDMQEANEESGLQRKADGKSGTASSKFSLEYPNITVKFSFLWEELDDCPECAYGGLLVISLKPLWGLEFRYDLTYAILRATGAGNSLAEIKSYLEGEGLKLFALIFSTGFSINLETKFEINHDGIKPTGTLDVTFPAKLEATLLKMSKKIKKFGVYAAVAFELGAKGESGFKVKLIATSAGVDYSIEWNGLKVTVSAKYNVCFSRSEKGCPPPGLPKGKENADGSKEGEDPSKEMSFTIPGKPLKKGSIYHSV